MKTQAFSILFSLLVFASCDFRKSVEKDLITGLLTKGDGLSCEAVHLRIGDENIQRNSFIYGEKFHLNFNEIEGFERISNHVFPGMTLIVVSEKGDTVMLNKDLYSNLQKGVDHIPLLLSSTVTVAAPIYSNGTYTLYVKIWDKKSDATFSAELDFTVAQNEEIQIKSDKLTYDEIYLYSKQRESVITDNIAYFDENVYILIEGLDGLGIEDDFLSLGLSMKVSDANGSLLIDEEDLLGDSKYAFSDLHTQLAANFVLTGSQVNNPVDCEIRVWDKMGEGQMKISTQVQIK